MCESNMSVGEMVVGNGSNCTSRGLEDYEALYLHMQFITGLILYPIVCFIGLAGNLLSIIVLAQRKMQTSTNTYLTALALSDSIKLINDSFYFFTILLMHTDPPSGNKAYGYLYPYAHYFFNMSVCITAWLTVSVAAERYILVCHATRARGVCNISRARSMSIIVFVAMSMLTIPLGLRYRTIHIYDNSTETWMLDVEVTKLWKDEAFVTGYTWVQNLLRSIIPLLILCILNYFIVQALRKTKTTKKRLSSRHRITMMLVSVIIVFLVCVTPDAIMSLFFNYGYYDANFLVRAIREITDLLLAVNSAFNFVLYCTFNKVFRKNFMALLCNRSMQKHLSETTQYRRTSFVTIRQTAATHGGGGGSTTRKDQPLVQNDYGDIQQSAM